MVLNKLTVYCYLSTGTDALPVPERLAKFGILYLLSFWFSLVLHFLMVFAGADKSYGGVADDSGQQRERWYRHLWVGTGAIGLNRHHVRSTKESANANVSMRKELNLFQDPDSD